MIIETVSARHCEEACPLGASDCGNLNPYAAKTVYSPLRDERQSNLPSKLDIGYSVVWRPVEILDIKAPSS